MGVPGRSCCQYLDRSARADGRDGKAGQPLGCHVPDVLRFAIDRVTGVEDEQRRPSFARDLLGAAHDVQEEGVREIAHDESVDRAAPAAQGLGLRVCAVAESLCGIGDTSARAVCHAGLTVQGHAG